MKGIVTGASRGLGLALTRALAERGWELVVDGRDAAALHAAVAELPASPPSRATSPTRTTAPACSKPPATSSTCSSTTRAASARPRCRRSRATRSTSSDGCTRSTSSPRSRWPSSCCRGCAGGRIVSVTSDAAVEPYETWGGYGSSKAALAQLTAILGAEQPALRVYAVDPGDMRTQMQQDAFPGEDISDRPPPEESVPGLLALIEGELPSGAYRARELVGAPA